LFLITLGNLSLSLSLLSCILADLVVVASALLLFVVPVATVV
jgi:hypothetical protein